MTFVRQAQYRNWQVKKTGVSIYILPHLHEDLQINLIFWTTLEAEGKVGPIKPV